MSPDGSPVPESAEATPAALPTWRAELRLGAGAAHAWLMRPRVRLTLVGVLLLVTGALVLTNSVWTLPLVIVGAMMVGTAWIGHRLEGRFAVEWGETGTQLAFRATIKAAQRNAGAVPALGEGPADATATAGDVIEGEAHTVEIDVAELTALIAAAEAADGADAADAPAETTVPRIHIHRIRHDGAHTPDAAA
ncbi:MAG TPA: hypothetical protein VHX62_05725 [Solirubrobacteraceae bacterium]|jgi:hypothetical protein|nr:hypothetical protein [Solirubrobacteraceae bacterium]